ncbi:MAG: phage antirepressor [Massilioclostridium sp.]|nr:phage antirepressor [Massilioclostridium sp.]
MNDLKIFNYHNNQVRTIEQDEEIWFVAADVCRALEIGNPSDAIARLDEDEHTLVLIEGIGKGSPVNVVNEPGLYGLVLGSRKPEAKDFKRWVKHEVLPSIRKHGAYLTDEKIEQILTDPDTIIRLATDLKNERAQRTRLESKIEEDKPYTDFGKAVEVSTNAVKIEVFAKTLCNKYGKKLGRNKLFKLLREHRVLFYENGQNVPFQDFINRGYFALKSTTFINKYGNQVTGFTTMITGKGQVYITEKIDNWLIEER